MGAAVVTTGSDAALARLETALDEVLALPLDTVSEDQILDIARRAETVRRRFAPLDHAVIGQLEARSTAFSQGARTTTVLLSQLLRISRGEAHARVKAAAALGARVTVTGQPVPPRFAAVAAAQAEGVLSERHAQVIVRTVDGLPVEVADQFGGFVEATLVERARELDPTVLAGHARDLAYALDQDGQYDEIAHRDKTRSFDFRMRPDGSAHLEGELTAECAAHLLTQLDASTKPKPDPDGTPDPRTATQRRRDAFLAILKLLERAELLPKAGGVTTTVLLTMDAGAWVTGQGTATTGHGYTVPADVAKQWAGFETRIILTLLDDCKAVAAYSSTHRLFTEGQRLAMLARDKGCTFPRCDAKAVAWLEAHHVQDWTDGGPTSIANGALACCPDHRHHEQMGWKAVMLDGRPHWKPPAWLDPQQVPRRNTRHD